MKIILSKEDIKYIAECYLKFYRQKHKSKKDLGAFVISLVNTDLEDIYAGGQYHKKEESE